jgi:hypothetical protein
VEPLPREDPDRGVEDQAPLVGRSVAPGAHEDAPAGCGQR